MDLFLFLKLKFKLNGLRFDTTEQILGSSQRVLNTVQESDFKQAFSKLQRVQNLHQSILMNGSSYPHLHISTTQPFRTGATESRNFLMAPRIMYRRHCEEDITVLKHCPSICEKRLMRVGVGVGVGVDFSKPESESMKFGRLRSPAHLYIHCLIVYHSRCARQVQSWTRPNGHYQPISAMSSAGQINAVVTRTGCVRLIFFWVDSTLTHVTIQVIQL